MLDCRVATGDELTALAVMRWESAADGRPPPQPREDFVAHFVAWAQDVRATHTPFVAVEGTPIGMAWLARVPRAPGADSLHRANGDLQTVFVLPDHRNKGVGETLVRAVLRYAWEHGMDAVTVAANTRALSLYQRVGFTQDALDLRLLASRSQDTLDRLA